MRSKPLTLPAQQPQIGLFLRDYRWELGLTQTEFAAHLGVVYMTISRWENGHTNPSPMARRVISRKLKRLGPKALQLLEPHLS